MLSFRRADVGISVESARDADTSKAWSYAADVARLRSLHPPSFLSFSLKLRMPLFPLKRSISHISYLSAIGRVKLRAEEVFYQDSKPSVAL